MTFSPQLKTNAMIHCNIVLTIFHACVIYFVYGKLWGLNFYVLLSSNRGETVLKRIQISLYQDLIVNLIGFVVALWDLYSANMQSCLFLSHTFGLLPLSPHTQPSQKVTNWYISHLYSAYSESALWADSVSKLQCPDVVFVCVPSRKPRFPVDWTCDTWHVTCDTWHVTLDTWFFFCWSLSVCFCPFFYIGATIRTCREI